MVTVKNLFGNRPVIDHGEHFQEWLRCKNVVIERIVSSDAPASVCYDQAQDEWVVLLQGTASLEVETQTITLGAGDALFIPARTRHRVLETSHDPQCIWLAVHIY